MTREPWFVAFAEAFEKIKPPRFDRVVVRDCAIFDSVPRISPPIGVAGTLLGIPVLTDDTLPPGIIELRMGDEVVDRVDAARPVNSPPRADQ